MEYTDIEITTDSSIENLREMIQQAFEKSKFKVQWNDQYSGKATRGIKGLDIIVGAFAPYYKIDFKILLEGKNAKVRLAKSSTGFWGSIIGIYKVKEQYGKVVDIMSSHLQPSLPEKKLDISLETLQNQRICRKCGEINKMNSDFCKSCGKSLILPDFVDYAGFWRRSGAAIIDEFIMLFCIQLPFLILCIELGLILTILEFIFFLYLIRGVYFVGMECSRIQATIGKKALGIVVTDLKGNRISPIAATLRYVTKLISASLFLTGFFLIAPTEKKQGLHDMIASCLVMKKKKAAGEAIRSRIIHLLQRAGTYMLGDLIIDLGNEHPYMLGDLIIDLGNDFDSTSILKGIYRLREEGLIEFPDGFVKSGRVRLGISDW